MANSGIQAVEIRFRRAGKDGKKRDRETNEDIKF